MIMNWDYCFAFLLGLTVGVLGLSIWIVHVLNKDDDSTREDGHLYVDRDQAVAKNMKSLLKMVRPGNYKGFKQ